jgi:ABC-2 type transport system ATP-binding protein
MSAVFELKNVTKQFGRQVALNNVSLVGESGTVVALLGENGAGKTTALRILLGLLEPDSGAARVFGLDSWNHGQEIRRRVGYVPDRPALYEWMTVDEIGWYCGGFYDQSFVKNYRRMICEFGLPLKKRISTMSRGMKAKVGLALSISHEPELLILDEPTSGLDPIVRREFLESMVDVAATDRTVLLSSHQIPEVERIADVVCIVKHGQLEIVERLEDLKTSLTELTVTIQNGATDIPTPPGVLIHRIQKDRQWRLLVRHARASEIEEFRQDVNVAAVELKQPTLEDIYVGYMQGGSSDGKS